MYEGMVDTSETCLVGPLQPLTIGLIPCGVLWNFLRKYMHCVLTLSEGCR